MSRELEFSGYWEGDELREKLGWITTKVDGEWYDFCCERCRNEFIKRTT